MLLAGLAACAPSDPVVDLRGLGDRAVLEPAAYQDELDVADSALEVAVDRVADAPTFAALESAVLQAEAVSGAAANRLGGLRPPPDRRIAHLDLVQDVSGFAEELALVSLEVATRQLCAAPSVMARISALESSAELRTHFGGLLPDPSDPPDRRLPNGAIVLDRRDPGDLRFDVANPGDRPVVVTLADGDRAVAAVYVAGGQTATVDRLPLATYTVYFTTGEDWDQQLQTFTRSCRFVQIDQPFPMPGTGGVLIESDFGALPTTELEPGTVPGDPTPAAGVPPS
jgi:hypothetical protein